MRRVAIAVGSILAVAWLFTFAGVGEENNPDLPADIPVSNIAGDINRSPVDLVLGPNDAWLVTVNQTSNTASLVSTADGKVLDEIAVGRRPAYAALCRDGRRVLISGNYSGDVTVLEVTGGKLKKIGTIDVGFDPVGIAIGPDGRTAYVALTCEHKVAILDIDKRQVTGHIEVGRWPRYLDVSADGKRLCVGTPGDRGVSVVDLEAGKLLYQVKKFKGLNIGHVQVSNDGNHGYFTWMHYGENLPSPGNIRRGWVLGNRVGRVKLDGLALREAFSLDKQGDAVGDAHGLALSDDEKWLSVSCSGTHEVLVISTENLPYTKIGGTEHVDPKMVADPQRFSRIKVGGRPMGLRIAGDNQTIYVANYLENAVQVIDIESRKLVRSIPLGGPKEMSQARQGEAIFLDANRSFDQWYSCFSCHYDGGTNSEIMDTLNDGSAYAYKTVLPLYNLLETSPWTWHGWQKDLRNAMHKSITSTMIGKPPSDADVDALLAYFKTLKAPPNPYRNRDGSLTEAAQRGKLIFESEKAGCANCHTGPYFTDGEIHDVGLGKSRDRYKGFNTPILNGVFNKVRLLHNGRARSLEELLTDQHSPEKVTGQGKLNERELKDLVEYVKSL